MCTQSVGRRVVVRDKNGQMYDGVLHAVRDDGIIVRPTNSAARQIAHEKFHIAENVPIDHALAQEGDSETAEPVFWWWWLIAWALIAGFWWWGGAGWGGYGRRGYGPYVGNSGYGGGFRGGGGYAW